LFFPEDFGLINSYKKKNIKAYTEKSIRAKKRKKFFGSRTNEPMNQWTK
jgi:hypothetical protein